MAILRIIPDIERRVALQLAFLRRWPFLNHTGCGRACQMCFKCKTSGHHSDTCEQQQRRELKVDLQFCPACGVATQKTEGCNQMVCVCGKYWEWRGNQHTNATVPQPPPQQNYPPCWGGSTLVITPNGGRLPVRDA